MDIHAAALIVIIQYCSSAYSNEADRHQCFTRLVSCENNQLALDSTLLPAQAVNNCLLYEK